MKKKSKKKKFVELKLWEVKDERSVIHIAFSKLLFVPYNVLRFLVVSCIVVAIIATPAINLGFEKVLPPWSIRIGVVVALFVATWEFLKIKSDQMLYYFMSSSLINRFIKKKVLVVDDFDRVSEKLQLESYKLFNILNGRLPIIFIGDISNISMQEDNYLQKIINRKIELPYALHPKNIWEDYFNELSNKFGVDLDTEFVKIFEMENRNLRDRDQFNEYVNQEFFTHGKLGHVQYQQQLVIIYIYLFHNEKYLTLLRGEEISKPKTVEELLSKLLTSNNDYPPCFEHNSSGYFLYESVSNMTEAQLVPILDDSEQLEEAMIKQGDIEHDFYQYVTRKYTDISFSHKKNLLKYAVKSSINNLFSPLQFYILSEKNREYSQPVQDDDSFKDTYDDWMNILKEFDLDTSQKLKFLGTNLLVSFYQLGWNNRAIDVFSDEYNEQKEKLYYLLTYLSFNNLWEEFDSWTEELWEKIDELFYKASNDYLIFFRYQRIIGLPEGTQAPSHMLPQGKKLEAYLHIKDLDDPRNSISVSDTLDRITPKLKILEEEKGFEFLYLARRKIEEDHMTE